MKVSVNKDACMGCGACTVTCSNVFEIGDDGYATVKVAEVAEEDQNSVVEAKEQCPTDAISVE